MVAVALGIEAEAHRNRARRSRSNGGQVQDWWDRFWVEGGGAEKFHVKQSD